MAFICGAGATNIDLLFSGFSRLAAEGEELYCKDFSLQLGGGVPATLINLGRLGIKTKIATQLGGDIFSDFARNQFDKNGVTPLNLYSGSEIPLNITSAIILPKDRTFYSYGNGFLQPDDSALEAFYSAAAGASICIMQPGGFLPVYRQLKKEGTVLVLDTGWDDELSFEKYGEYLEAADYYTPNRKEAMKITGKQNPEEAATALKAYFNRVVVKLDADGCLGIDEGGEFFVPSVSDFRCVDSTGAGDAFLAGFIYGLFNNLDFKDCIRLGNITGGKCVTAVGALSAYLNERELLEHKKKIYG